MHQVIRDIRYGGKHERHCGDLFLPDKIIPDAGCVLLIHGGGWNQLNKESFETWAQHFNARGRPVFNINYRLLQHAPWPACLDDCLIAGRFILAGNLQSHGVSRDQPILICGGSAGGHLTMMTALRLGKQKVQAAISISGPATMDFPDGSSKLRFQSREYIQEFFGDDRHMTREDYDSISPPSLAHADAPPLYCIHSRNDRLVPVSHSIAAVNAWRAVGVQAELYEYDGPGEAHGIWTNDSLDIRQPIPIAVVGLNRFLDQIGN